MSVDASVLSLITALAALVITIFVLWRMRGTDAPLTPQAVTTTVRDAMTQATELTEVAETAVKASEQLWRTGRIEKGERLDRAFAYVKHWFPYLDQDTIITALEASVLVVNSVAASLPAKSRTGTPK
jgi:hypothetical protein